MPARIYDLITPDTDRQAATDALAQALHAPSAALGGGEWEAWLPAARDRLAAAFAAADRGHAVEWDPPAALTSVTRWTCTRCGSAVLVRHDIPYGTAYTEDCAVMPDAGDQPRDGSIGATP